MVTWLSSTESRRLVTLFSGPVGQHRASQAKIKSDVGWCQAEFGAPEIAAEATRDRFGRIDILVNNAGIGPGAIRPDSWQRPLKFWEITPDQWRRFVAVHTTAPLALTNAVVPEMMREGWGRIVNVTTSLGTMLNAGSPTYGPSKAALEALSAIMAKDLDGTGVTVNVLVPGATFWLPGRG